jgi:hypothetical protein
MNGRKILMKSTIMEFILKIIAFTEIFLIRLQKIASTGPEIEMKI